MTFDELTERYNRVCRARRGIGFAPISLMDYMRLLEAVNALSNGRKQR